VTAVATRRLKAGTKGHTGKGKSSYAAVTQAVAAATPMAPGRLAPGIAKEVPSHFIEVPPNAYKTLSAIREMGYDTSRRHGPDRQQR
jgi:hypothetical protein